METETTTTGGKPSGTRLAKLWDAIAMFLGIRVRMWVFLVAAMIVAVLIAAVAEGVKTIDRQQRDADARAAAQIAYTAQLRTYDLEVRARADCLAGVARADANRGQHEQIVVAFRNLTVLFPDSQGLATAVDAIVADLEAGPLLSSPPRDASECPVEPVPPEPPAELIGAP